MRLTIFSLLLALSPIPKPTHAQFPSSFRVHLLPQRLNLSSSAPNPNPPVVSKAPTLPPSASIRPPAPVAAPNPPPIPLFLFQTQTTHHLWTTTIPELTSSPAVSSSAASTLFSTLFYDASAYTPIAPVPAAYSVSSGALLFALTIQPGATIEWAELATFANDLAARAGNLEPPQPGRQAGGAWYGTVARLRVEMEPWVPAVPFELPPKPRVRRRQSKKRSWETTGGVVAEWRVLLASQVV